MFRIRVPLLLLILIQTLYQDLLRLPVEVVVEEIVVVAVGSADPVAVAANVLSVTANNKSFYQASS